MSMHQPQKKQRHSLVRYRKCVIIRTSYAKKWISTLTTVIGGNFNAEIGKRIGSENCISQWLRGRRNESGSKLAEFCEMSNKVITNSCFQHPSKHITTWFQRRINPTTKIFSNTQIRLTTSSYTRSKNRPSLMHDVTEEQKHHQIIDLL